MAKNDNNETETLPLNYAYPYLVEKGLENDVIKIKQSRDKYKNIHQH